MTNNDRIDALYEKQAAAAARAAGIALEDIKLTADKPAAPALVPVTTWAALMDHVCQRAEAADAAQAAAGLAQAADEPEEERNTALEKTLAAVLGIAVEVRGNHWEPAEGYRLFSSRGNTLALRTYLPGDEEGDGPSDHFWIHYPGDLVAAVNRWEQVKRDRARLEALKGTRPAMPLADTVQLARAEWWYRPTPHGQTVNLRIATGDTMGGLVDLALTLDEARRLADALDSIYDSPDDTRTPCRYQVQTSRHTGYLVMGRDIQWGSSMVKVAATDGGSRASHNMDRREAGQLATALHVQIGYMAAMTAWVPEYEKAGGWVSKGYASDYDEAPF